MMKGRIPRICMRKLSLYELENHIIKNKNMSIQSKAILTITIRQIESFRQQMELVDALSRSKAISPTQKDLDYVYSMRGYINRDEVQKYDK